MDIKAELVSIGNELLNGRTLNTHGQDLGAALSSIGILLVRDTTVLDDIHLIQNAVKEALDRTGLVFVSGGLGPTVDDITRDALCELLDQRLVHHEPTIKFLHEWNRKRGREMPKAGERQALVFEHATVLANPVGAAPGQRIELSEGRILFVLPGPPREFNAILSQEIVPYLKIQFAHIRPELLRIVQTKGIGESSIVAMLEEADYKPENIALGFYPGMGRVEIRLTASPESINEIEAAVKTLSTLLSDYLDPDT